MLNDISTFFSQIITLYRNLYQIVKEFVSYLSKFLRPNKINNYCYIITIINNNYSKIINKILRVY